METSSLMEPSDAVSSVVGSSRLPGGGVPSRHPKLTALHRRAFLSRSGVGFGSLALSWLMNRQLAAAVTRGVGRNKHDAISTSYNGVPGLPRLLPKVKRVIFLCMA